jgi:hypothetical protein
MKRESVDSKNRPHSVNDISAEKYWDDNYVWYNHGDVHRDGDKPAIVSKKAGKYKVWAKNDFKHRVDDKPAEMDRTRWAWYQSGLTHRLTGPADIRWTWDAYPEYSETNACSVKASGAHLIWGLYGVTVPEGMFFNIMTYIEEQGCPPWVAWFYFCEIFEDEDIVSLKEASADWTVPLPITWIFNIYNLTDEKIKTAYQECRFYVRIYTLTVSANHKKTLDQLLIEIINYETETITDNSAMAKDILADLNSSKEILAS